MKRLKDFPFRHVLVLGLAKSGEAASRLLYNSGIPIRVNDQKPLVQNPKAKELQDMGIEVITGSHPLSILDDIDLVVKNPGIPYSNVIVEEAEQRGIPIVTEIELAWELVEGPLIGITGSNGKTTTTTLTYEMLKESQMPVKLAGNIGNVACEVAQTTAPEDRVVMELSSFQLLGTRAFKPHIAVFLNIFEAHLDYHQTIDHYSEAKANIFTNQTENDWLIYNAEDPIVSELAMKSKSKKLPFSVRQSIPNGIWCDDDWVYFQLDPLIRRKDIVLVGKHNLENILAAVAAAKLAGATNDGINKVLSTFSGVEHRLQFVRELNGRKFYNDSKATNNLATSKALDAFEQPVILLAGGLDRGNSFQLLSSHLKHVKAMVLFGETAPKIKEIAEQNGIDNIIMVDNVKQAAEQAYAFSYKDDIILLSPACASWDQYRTFEERGDMFMEAVHRLE